MRNITTLFMVACLLSLLPSSFAQPPNRASDPFAADPFGGDPFGGDATKPPAAKSPNKKNMEHPKAATVHRADRTGRAASGQASSDAENRIRAALDDETSQNFVDVPLVEAVQQLSHTHNIPIVVDRRALEEIGLTPDQPVNLSLTHVTLRSFLRLMLRELDLTYMVKDEVMQITTVEAAEQNLVVEMYRFSEELTDKSERIIEALRSSVVPATWDLSGGPSSVTAIDNVLIVSTTEAIHDEVIDFLQKLERAFEKHHVKK